MDFKGKSVEKLDLINTREEIIENQIDIVIPDNVSDVLRVSAVSADVMVKDKNAGADRVTVNGTYSIRLLCVTEKSTTGEIIKYVNPFSHVMTNPGIGDENIIACEAKIFECTSSVVGTRKLSVKIRMMLNVRTYAKKTCHLATKIPEDGKMHCLLKDYHDEYTVFLYEKQLRMVENITLENGEIRPFRWSVDFVTEDIKVIKDKIMLRGTCQLRVLFVNESTGEMSREKYHLPFSSVVENETFDKAEKIDVRYCCPYAEISTTNTAAGHILNCDVVADIRIIGKSSLHEKIVADVFNSKYEVEIKSEKLEGMLAVSSENIRKDVSADLGTINNADKVCDFTYTVLKSFSDKKIFATIVFDIIYKDSMDECYNVSCKYDAEYEMDNSFCDTEVEANNISLQCTENGGIRMDGQLVLKVDFGSIIETNQVVACNIIKDALRTRKTTSTLVLRKIIGGESIWEMAKKYNTSPDAIKQANKIEDNLDNMRGKLIMIPIVK